MKLKFGKTPSGYIEGVRQQVSDLSRQLEKARADIRSAEVERVRCDQQYTHYLEQSRSEYLDQQGHSLLRAKEAADLHLDDCKWAVHKLDLEMTPLQWILEAPEAFERAKQTLTELVQQHKQLTHEIERLSAMLVKLHERSASLEDRLARESRAAGLALLDDQAEFTMPEGIARLELELRVMRSTLGDETLRLGELKVELESLPARRKEARQDFISARATVVEMELEEKLQEFLPMIARATAARAISIARSLPGGYEIKLPQALMESTRATLEAEVPN